MLLSVLAATMVARGGMLVTQGNERLRGFVDTIHRLIQTGMELDAAAEQAKMLVGRSEPMIDEAVKAIRDRISAVEVLRDPTTIRRRRKAWYPGPRETDAYWPRLRDYLLHQKNWDGDTVASIDAASTRVLSCVDFPGTPEFSTRGLVVGYVQSGKTANFTALISKAADASFRLFIVLSGLTNSLRQQTQERLDQELVDRHPNKWLTWTNATGDIGDLPFNVNALLDGDHRHLAVVKKNAPRLRRLLRMVRSADERIRRNCPVLVIDDECDQASVNASGVQERSTAINRLLRDLLAGLPRVAYVGYTATPYANILIDPAYPQDFYPRDFIVALPRPAAYFGPERLFGRDLLDADPVPQADEGLDMIRTVPEEEIPGLRPQSQSTRAEFELQITPTLREAILYYALATAARCVRGQQHQHSSMLIHSTVYSLPHMNSQPVVEQLVKQCVSRCELADRSFLAELRALWEREQARVDATVVGQVPIAFDELQPQIASVLREIEVVVENGLSDQRLDFSKPGRRYLVIGGNVLARGLTIEGLVASFFLRTSSQYDSLMQMGRWFGYRHGYEDLPRIWMTSDMADYFKDMATVEAEIRNDIAVYEREGLDPSQFAVRVRRHPVLAITARNKMMAARDCKVSFDGRHIQTRKFRHRDEAWLDKNWHAGARLVDRARAEVGDPVRHGSHVVFRGIPVVYVVEFLKAYSVHDAHEDIHAERVVGYIAEQNRRDNGALGVWNLAVIGTAGPRTSDGELGTLGRVATVVRARLKSVMQCESADIKALMTRGDAAADLDIDVSKLTWDQIKERRRDQDAPPLLLLYPIDRVSEPRTSSSRKRLDAVTDVLGMAIVFPKARIDTPIGYVCAPIDTSGFEEAEYQEEQIPDDA